MPRPSSSAPLHLLVAHDLSAEADLALARAAQLVNQCGARLSLVYVHSDPTGPVPTPIRPALEARLGAYAMEGAALHIHSGPAMQTLVQLLEGLAPSLLLLGAHHARSTTGFAGTTLEGLLIESRLPLLLVIRRTEQPYQRALAGLDFSTCANQAVQCLWPLLDAGAQLQAIHVLEGTTIHPPAAEELALQHSLLNQWVDELRASLPDAPVQLSPALYQGERYGCLEQAITDWQPQLLALGVHRRGLISQTLVGGLVSWCLTQPPCDLLLVPGR